VSGEPDRDRARPRRPWPRSPRERAEPAFPAGFARGHRNRAALAVLASLPSLTPRRLVALAARVPTAGAALTAVRRGGQSSDDDRARAAELDGEAVLRGAADAGARLVGVGDGEYPASLLDLFDPPAGIFVRGADLRSAAARVAVVGARNPTPDGEDASAGLASALAGAGACVVSGAARGIDAAAHRGALAVSGATIAVLGCGIDVAYPRQNASLIERIAERGTVLSEYPPGTRAEPFRFPARNRIVAGLSRAVVIVEGASGSGSMITADHALDLGRDVFAVPGPVTSELATVPLALIRDGATMIRGAGDLLEDLGMMPEAGSSPGPPGSGAAISMLAADEAAVLGAVSGSASLERIASGAGLPVSRTIAALVGLEVRGLVRARGGRYEPRPRPG